MRTIDGAVRLRFKVLALSLITLLALSLNGCVSKSTPPGPIAVGGKYDRAGFQFLRWDAGLTIMIWHDLESFTSHGSGSTTDPVYRLQGSAESQDGRHVDWVVETVDGKTAQFWIDDTSYDLSDGTLFVITTEHGRSTVAQLARDLSRVQPNYESCVAFATNDPDLIRLIGGTLAGHVNVGPLVPVSREGIPDPTPAPEVYADRKIVIYAQDGETEIARVDIDAQGNYEVALPIGQYMVDINHMGVDRGIDLPVMVEILGQQVTNLDIAIDTGIR